MWSQHKMYCTICGKQYLWDTHFGFSKSRTCSWDCHSEWQWRNALSMLGHDYYLRPKLGLDFGNVIKGIGGPMMDGFLDAFKELTKLFRHDIYIISRVNDDAGSKKALAFLEENHLINCEGGFEPFHVNFCLKRDEKAGIAQGIGLTHFVDDRTEVLHHMKGVVRHRFALNPTQRQLDEFPPKDVAIAPSWKELTPLIINSVTHDEYEQRAHNIWRAIVELP